MKQILLDSSVVLDLFTRDPMFYQRSLSLLTELGARHELLINDAVYAEVSVGFRRIESLNKALHVCEFVHGPIPKEALFLASKAYLDYRRRGGSGTSPLPDFFIGAHAAVAGIPLVTRDPSRVRAAYPGVEIIEP